jgi:hypothetical protein
MDKVKDKIFDYMKSSIIDSNGIGLYFGLQSHTSLGGRIAGVKIMKVPLLLFHSNTEKIIVTPPQTLNSI